MKNKVLFYLYYILIYGLLITAEILLFNLLPISNVLVKLIIGSFVGLLITYIAGLIIKNSNMFNLYFPINTVVLVLLYASSITELNLQSYIMISVIICWALRMIINYFMNHKDSKEDYRYSNLRNHKLWFLINLFFVHIIPSAVFFLVIIPTFNYLELSTLHNWNLSTFIGICVTIFGLLYEMIADLQKYKFKKINKNPLDVCTFGLWATSRHPNYFGEILFWWGTFLTMLSLSNKFLVTAGGPLILTMMICFVSIPTVEKKQVMEKADYPDYIELVSMIIPLKRQK